MTSLISVCRCRASAKTLDQKGTAVPKDTQRTATTDQAQLQLPERVTVAVAELATAAREGLLALAVGTGLQVLEVMLAEDVTRLVGAKGRHIPERSAVRHGSEPGQVTLGGRRVRAAADSHRRWHPRDGGAAYQAFAATDLLDQLAVERMLAKLSTRRYRRLEPVGTRSSRRRRAPPVGGLAPVRGPNRARPGRAAHPGPVRPGLVALMVDGIRVAEHCCVVALASPSTAPRSR